MRQVIKTKLPKLFKIVQTSMAKCGKCPNKVDECCKLVSQGKAGFCFRM